MSRSFWFEFGFPAATIVLAGAIVYDFAVLHPAASASAPAAAVHWPPSPDTAALSALPLPRTIPFELRTAAGESRMIAEYDGTLTLDADGLHVRPAPGTRLLMDPDWGLPATLDSVVFGVAEPAPTGWRIAYRGAAFVPPGGAFTVPPELTVPGVRAVDLVGRWPVLVHHYTTEYGPPGAWDVTMALQGRWDAFVPLLSEGGAR
jgi:hypothetical protein